jgi:uncharacterized protein
MEIKEIIDKYYPENSRRKEVLVNHGEKVARKALTIAQGFNLDMDFIEKASLIHDIGIFLVQAPLIDCHGELPYICHGYLGREIMEKENLPSYALICERHVGMGLEAKEIKAKNLPLPLRDMVPMTSEEEVVCLADKFFSKTDQKELAVREIEEELEKYGFNHKERFQQLIKKFNV